MGNGKTYKCDAAEIDTEKQTEEKTRRVLFWSLLGYLKKLPEQVTLARRKKKFHSQEIPIESKGIFYCCPNFARYPQG